MNDPYNLNRFLKAQEKQYADALSELKSGRKKTHWIWYFFPQIEGLGRSSTSQFYSLKSVGEVKAYWNHPVLRERLVRMTEAVIESPVSIKDMFGYPDYLKFISSMTIFALVLGKDSPEENENFVEEYSIFHKAVRLKNRGQFDKNTQGIGALYNGK